MRLEFLSLFLLISVSSASLLRKSFSRRQADSQYCQAIEGFDCKCSYYRVTCTTENDLQAAVSVLPQEKEKYQSVELVITGQREYNIQDSTFASVKELFKPDADNVEFRVKFEKFTALNLQSPGIFNRVFPDNLPSNARKYLALEIYNPEVQPHDNPELFRDLNADSLELYVLYPFRGSFQELFNGANIKYLRLSGGDIKSDLSKPFSGNIGRLELAKQASSLSIQNFPVYPAHELIINAYYVSEFNNDSPPNYSNLGELRIHTPERIPANAFQHFSNIHTLSVSTEKDIDPQAFNGLNNLEKLIIKDTRPSIEILNSVPSLKEFETQVEKLDEQSQCQLIEKLANGQVAIQAIPNGPECTCVTAYLDTASGRYPCDAQNCEQSTCSAIRNNYDASTRTFKAPPAIRRSDGSDALRPREVRVHTTPYQIPARDQEKLQHSMGHHSSGSSADSHQQQPEQDHQQQPEHGHQQQPEHGSQPSSQLDDDNDDDESQSQHHRSSTDSYDSHGQHAGHGDHHDVSQNQASQGDTNADNDDENPSDQGGSTGDSSHQHGSGEQQHGAGEHPHGTEEHQHNQPDAGSADSGSNTDGASSNDQSKGEGEAPPAKTDGESAAAGGDGSSGDQPAKEKKINWLLILLIAGAILGLILIVVVCIILQSRKKNEYKRTASSEQSAAAKA